MNKISMQIAWPLFAGRLPVVGRPVENVARHLHVCIPLSVVRVGRGFLRSPVLAPPVGHPLLRLFLWVLIQQDIPHR